VRGGRGRRRGWRTGGEQVWDVEPAKAPGRGENGADDAGTGMGNCFFFFFCSFGTPSGGVSRFVRAALTVLVGFFSSWDLLTAFKQNTVTGRDRYNRNEIR
jgi:hypothetical protein